MPLWEIIGLIILCVLVICFGGVGFIFDLISIFLGGGGGSGGGSSGGSGFGGGSSGGGGSSSDY